VVSATYNAKVKHHLSPLRELTRKGTTPGGQFGWGGSLRQDIGGALRSAHPGQKSGVECKGKSWPDWTPTTRGPEGKPGPSDTLAPCSGGQW